MDDNNISNLDDTQKIYDLCQIPQELRNDEWKRSFFQFIPAAIMAVADPQVIIGPDKLSYFVLNLPNGAFKAASLAHLLGHLTANGLGLVINPLAKDKPDWVFSYGDLWNFKETGVFIFDIDRWKNIAKNELESNSTARNVLVTSPSNEYLPMYVRKSIFQTLRERFRLADPAVFLIDDMSLSPFRNLVFNVFAEEHDPVIIQHIYKYLAWSLPRDYGLVGISRDSELVRHFQALYSSE